MPSALVGRSTDLLVLDEPTAGINVAGRHEFWQAHARGRGGRARRCCSPPTTLEEADAYADRIVLIAHGADHRQQPGHRDQGAGRVPHDQGNAAGIDLAALGALPALSSADRHGDAVLLSCSDADTALRALLASFPAARDIEVRGAASRRPSWN